MRGRLSSQGVCGSGEPRAILCVQAETEKPLLVVTVGVAAQVAPPCPAPDGWGPQAGGRALRVLPLGTVEEKKLLLSGGWGSSQGGLSGPGSNWKSLGPVLVTRADGLSLHLPCQGQLLRAACQWPEEKQEPRTHWALWAPAVPQCGVSGRLGEQTPGTGQRPDSREAAGLPSFPRGLLVGTRPSS